MIFRRSLIGLLSLVFSFMETLPVLHVKKEHLLLEGNAIAIAEDVDQGHICQRKPLDTHEAEEMV